MSPSPCNSMFHRALAADEERLRREARYIGLQADGDGGVFELWNHEAPCGSTFSRVPAALDEVELRGMADRFAATLTPGRVIDSDNPFITPFSLYIPAALARRHMELEDLHGGGWVVRATVPDANPTIEMCTWCQRLLAECTCNEAPF